MEAAKSVERAQSASAAAGRREARPAAGKRRPWPFGRRRRVPVQLQLSDVECGAACLAMILSYHGRATRVAECRERFGIGRDGVTALSIVRAARGYGLRVKAYTLEPDDFAYVPLPAIVHWNFSHFVVVERWTPRAVEIVDPASGRRRISADEFDAGFTGVVLTFEPGAQFERRRESGAPSGRSYLRAYLTQSPGLLAQILLASLFLQLLGLALPVITKVLVDDVVPLHLTNVMGIFGVGIALVILANVVTSYLRSALLIRLQGRLDAGMMVGFFEHLLALPYRFFEQRTAGDLLLRLGSNAVIRDTLTSQTLSLIFDGSLVVGYLAVLLTRDLTYGLLVLGIGLLQAGILAATRRRVHDLAEKDLAAQSESQSYLVEALKGMAVLKASGAEDRALDHWSNLFYHQLNVSLQRNHLSAVVETAMGALRTFSPLILLWLGASRVLDGSMSLGTMLALNTLAGSFLTPLASLVSNGQRLQVVKAHLDRLSDVLEAAPEQERQAVRPAPRLSGRIELKDVGFRYDPSGSLVLEDVSLTVEPGQKVALVGPTGAGKSTLVKLLLGLYEPSEGEIRYDGIPAGQLDYRTIRSQFGVVLQEAVLFSGSIRENIALNDPSIPLEQVMAAAKLAGLHDDIARMPMGYETLVHEGGTGLSGGQRQRLSLARALAHKPAILLLDEATSHLDVVTEALVEENLNRIRCTRIVIAHRLSTVRNADVILVVEDGT
ncbi:MAG: peptidase domain-containing ABC transporter, partial [Thermomicrobiaceae bacterium]|nr:peptidase domain-containing ABC transporter [Thermomicrobiaceae bacterium]